MTQEGRSNLSREQKIGFVFLLIFGILAIGLGALQLRNTIYGPFVLKIATSEKAPLILDEHTRLQSIDTDHDGLNDFEELNFYQTSPYISDTDSDGIEDYQEVSEGTDPLCPKGEDCSISESVASSDNSTSTLMTSPLETVTPFDILSQSFPTSTSENINMDMSQFQDPAQLRKAILQTGEISEEELAAIDDKTLLSLMDQLIQEEGLKTNP